MAWKTRWAVSIDGRDATSAMNDRLRKITIDEREGDGGDSASLDFDDVDAALTLPRAGARVRITLAGLQKFDGWTEEPEWSLDRGGGRTWTVHCTAHDGRGKVKDPQHWHLDGGTLEVFLNRAAKEAGLSAVRVAPAFAALVRPWWSPEGATFLQLGRRLSEELGGLFRLRGDVAVLAERGAGRSASGAALPAVVFDASAGAGVRAIKAHPFSGPQSRSRAKATWFDRATGKYRSEEVEITPLDGAPASTARSRWPSDDADHASGRTKGRKTKADHDKGGATVEHDLRVDVVVGAPARLTGTRPGVDGDYKIKSANHELDRAGGGRSRFELARPSGAAGTDGRKKTSAIAAPPTPSGVQEAGSVSASPTA